MEEIVKEIGGLAFIFEIKPRYSKDKLPSLSCSIIDKSKPVDDFDKYAWHLGISDWGNRFLFDLNIRDDIFDRIKEYNGGSRPFSSWEDGNGYPNNYVYFDRWQKKTNIVSEKAIIMIAKEIGSNLLNLIFEVYPGK